MKIKYNNELISGGIFAIVAAVVWFLIPAQIQTMEKSQINAQTIPRFAIGGLFIFAVALFIQGLLREKKTVVVDSAFFRSASFKKESRSIFFAALLIVYAVLFNVIGFILDTVILVSVILFFYHCRKWWYYAIAIATVFIVYAVFTFLLNVNLPTLLLP